MSSIREQLCRYTDGPIPTEDQNAELSRRSRIWARRSPRSTGLLNLDYNFSQRADVGLRVFTLGNNRDEISALNGIAGNPTCVFSGPARVAVSQSPGEPRVANPVYGDHVGAARELRAEHSRLRRLFAIGAGVGHAAGGLLRHRQQRGLFRRRGLAVRRVSRGQALQRRAFVGAHLRRQRVCVRRVRAAGIARPVWGSARRSRRASTRISFAGRSRSARNLRLSGGLYDANYSSFGNTLNWRARSERRSRNVERRRASRSAPASARRCSSSGISSRPSLVNGKLAPNPGLPPPDANCVVPQGNPNERPEHATEYELGYSNLFSSTSNLDVSIYRSNLRDTIENYYPGAARVSFAALRPNSPTRFRSTSATPSMKGPKRVTSRCSRA